MHIFIPAYILLALASWSALAVPLSGHERDNVPAQKDSSSPSILMSRQMPDIDGLGPEISGPGFSPDSPPPTFDDSGDSGMDCGCGSKHKHNSKDHDNTDRPGFSDATTTINSYPGSSMTSTGPGPAIARRRFRGPMRRDSKDAPSIFERDDAPTTNPSNKPITVGDVLAHYLQQRAASRKRAESPKTSRGHN